MTERKERSRYHREQMNEGLIEGRNALTEALRAGRTIDKVYVASGDIDRNLSRLVAEARQAGAVVVRTERAHLDQMSPTGAHQGVIASVAAHGYSGLDDVFARAEARGEPPLIVLCDGLSDPHNLGAILRSAECAGGLSGKSLSCARAAQSSESASI